MNANLLKTRQVHLTTNFVSITEDGKAVGLDAAAIKSVEKVAVGVFKVVMKKRTHGDYMVTSLVSNKSGTSPSHIASDAESFTVKVVDMANKPKDAGFSASFYLHETRYVY